MQRHSWRQYVLAVAAGLLFTTMAVSSSADDGQAPGIVRISDANSVDAETFVQPPKIEPVSHSDRYLANSSYTRHIKKRKTGLAGWWAKQVHAYNGQNHVRYASYNSCGGCGIEGCGSNGCYSCGEFERDEKSRTVRWMQSQESAFLARNARAALRHQEWRRCKFGYFLPTGGGGSGVPMLGHYNLLYAANPYYVDQRDALPYSPYGAGLPMGSGGAGGSAAIAGNYGAGLLYAAQGYGVPVAVPLAPNVEQTYNYGWGIPSSRLTNISVVVPPRQ